ncbi:MAG: Phytanoyl-CoA dioxygenase family protein [Chloroflexota bacterium]|nr:Phytanoyl-CoA dioxygenase family protein [Chloroflexota bacterium]
MMTGTMIESSLKENQSARHRVKVAEYIDYHRDGFIVARGLAAPAAVAELKAYAEDLLHGRIDAPGVHAPKFDSAPADLYARFTRIHMIHRHHAVAEKYFLYPPVIDVLEALIGPDVLALQTMLFLNPPGLGGQGWHQDAYYIPTFPDTLIGVWMALERADEENGCLWVIPGSHAEPIYPTPERHAQVHAEESFADLEQVENVSMLDDSINTLIRVVRKYPDPIPVVCEPGDVIFFHSHLLHRSHRNRTTDRFRRAFVSHYCNARAWAPWNHGQPWEGPSANHLHILARGATHLPSAQPKFGTPVYTASEAVTASGAPMRMMAVNGDMQ